jgi:hypothetical protein
MSRGICPLPEVERQAGSLRVRVIAAAVADVWDCSALRREQLTDNDVGQIQEVRGRQRSEWRDIADHSPFYKGCWAQWNSFVVRDVLERQNIAVPFPESEGGNR